jgi:hypothetical protein
MSEIELFGGVLINKQVFVMLLMVPVVATIVGIARHIIGVKSLGIYAPLVITFSLYALGLNSNLGDYSDVFVGIRNGLVFLTVTLATAAIGSTLIKRSRMNYYPKLSIVISLTAIGLLCSIILASFLGKYSFNSVNALAIIMIASVAEQFTTTLFTMKFKTTLLITLETTMTSIFAYVLIAWPSFQELLINRPYLILIIFAINYLVGKYRGLRFREFVRFRKILDVEPEE